ncbi:MAG: hypothetical protein ABSE56_02455 [Bryobacteraceae bacterium]|jgi:hypothetical protein
MGGFTPIPAGAAGPVGIVVAVIGTIVSLFQTIFGGGGSDPTAALNSLRDSVVTLGQNLTTFACRLARALGKLLTALHDMWIFVIRPILEKIQQLATRLSRLIDKVLKPYLDFMRRMRQLIMDIYNRFFRPIIQFIESIRRVLAIFKLFHMKWAQRLDARLARLEGRVMSPILALLRHTSVAGSWLNLLLTIQYTLQRPIFVRTLWAYQGDVVNTFWGSQSFNPPATPPAAPAPPDLQQTGQTAQQNLKDLLTADSGPYAASIQDALQKMQSQPSV